MFQMEFSFLGLIKLYVEFVTELRISWYYEVVDQATLSKPNHTKLYDSNFIVRMLYKQVY